MIFRKLQIRNIRSHEDSEIDFSEGFNCVVGGVGAGKTSILLSLHFGLYGESLHRGYDYLLSESKSRAYVSVEFEQSNKIYRITRNLKRERGKIVQDSNELRLFEMEKIIAWGKTGAVQEYLRHLTGVDRKMFEEFIWIQQERLKDILNMTPRQRQEILDGHFGFANFQKAWELLLPYQRHYEGVIDSLEKDPEVTNIKSFRSQYEEHISELIRIQVELESLKVELNVAEENLRKTDEELEEVEEYERRITRLKEEKSEKHSRYSETAAYVESLNIQISRKQAELERNEDVLIQLENEKSEIFKKVPAADMDMLRKIASNLEERLADAKEKLASEKAGMEKTVQTLNTVKGLDVCPLCRREIDADFKEKLAGQLNSEWEDAGRNIVSLQKIIGDIESERQRVAEVKSKAEILEMQIDQTRRLILAGRGEIESLRRELEEKRLLLEEIGSVLARIDAEISNFKVEKVVRARERREEALLRFRNIQNNISHQEKMVEEKNLTLEMLEERIRFAEEKLSRKELAEKVVGLISSLRYAYREVVPRLRRMYIESLRGAVQSVMESLTVEGGGSFHVDVDEAYTPFLVDASGFRRESQLLSGGERTWLALAFRIGLGQLLMEAKTGQPFELLILDEPTEALGVEDGSIETLASAISNLKNIRQIITVTHSEKLAEKALKRIVVDKRDGVSRVENVD